VVEVRRLLIVIGLIAAVVVSAGAAFVVGSRASGPSGGATAWVPTSTGKVVRRDLVDRQSFNGTLGYGSTSVVANHPPGTITAQAAVGGTVERGKKLYAVDGRAVYLMYGSTPAYRDLKTGVSDGDDVKQLEQDLVALGFAGITPNDHFDSYTEAAVKRWQRSIRVTEDGIVPLGMVVFQPAAVRIAAWHGGVGEAAGPNGPILDVTGTRHIVSIDLDARRQDLAVAGAAVTVTLTDGKAVAGHISEVGKVAQAASSGGVGGQTNQATIKVYVILDDAAAGGGVDQAPVQVGLARGSRKGVLAVPVNALMARPDGTYVLEVDSGGRRKQVAITTGLFAEGMVEVSGAGIAEGTVVVVPAQ
jgi:peptidoglycan hydrolase-like protein with peptidoglycan-binding domain